MRVPAKTRRQQIITAATDLFSRNGFDGTTTRQIAVSAGVNEAIIFRHFTSKEELYWEVVSEQIARRKYSGRVQHHSRSSQITTERLSEIAQRLLELSKEDATLTRLLLFSALRDGELSEKLLRNYLRGPLNLLSGYIRQGVERGWLRKIDPVVGARAFLGMVAAQNLIQELFSSSGHQKHDSRHLGQQLADMWLNGITARSGRPVSRLGSNGSARGVIGTGGNGHKSANKVAGNVSVSTRKHSITA